MTATVHVRVAQRAHFNLTAEGEYNISHQDNVICYQPIQDNDAFIKVDGIRIGHGFHWQQEVSMLLPGIVRIVRNDDGTNDLYNILDIDTYLTSVISSEMSGDAPLEFLKAHAIVSRSWVMGKILHRHDESLKGKVLNDREFVTWEDTADHEGFDVCADDHCQRYQGVARVNENVRKAVNETSGLLLTDENGEVIDARFSKCCGGITEKFSTCWQDTDKEYLQSFADPWCNPDIMDNSTRNALLNRILRKYDRSTEHYFKWQQKVSTKHIEDAMLRMYNIKTGTVTNISPESRGPSGRIYRLRIEAQNGVFFVGKELAIRRLLHEKCLYSSNFEVDTLDDGNFRLHGRGWGHGVGFCQIGAAVMADKGKSAREILSFYYPETKLELVEKL